MSAPDHPATAPPPPRVCAGCGEEFQPRRRGRPSRYCRPACRQRAWALRRAEAELLAEGMLAPPAPAPSAPAPSVPAPTDARGWTTVLGHLEAQLNDPDSDLARRPWEHVQIYDALGRALAALDATTPGGLEWLDRHDLDG